MTSALYIDVEPGIKSWAKTALATKSCGGRVFLATQGADPPYITFAVIAAPQMDSGVPIDAVDVDFSSWGAAPSPSSRTGGTAGQGRHQAALCDAELREAVMRVVPGLTPDGSLRIYDAEVTLAHRFLPDPETRRPRFLSTVRFHVGPA